ncbi:hypothetical protein [Janibacter cremeus]|uniref:Uncharacterized protein n=1 Tax=Janibacter cremeus TaxID=1285192 RepID=A0A852VV14_9MICO|nr:hypothetical protein [Janibacter cremeus]NYF97401.1 hypothetical protein [Janibacter cremeus]
MPHATNTAPSPSRRSVAKGVAWLAPAVTIAAAAPRLAASDVGCSAEGQQEIDNAITLAKTKSAQLQLNFYQLAAALDGTAQRVYVNLKNLGTAPVLASPENPIIITLTLHTADPAQTRWVTSFGTRGWGTVDKGEWTNGMLTFTWTITTDLPVVTSAGSECDMYLALGPGGGVTPGKQVHAEAVMTSFGVNDVLTGDDFPALHDIVDTTQVMECQEHYYAQVQANLTANYTLYASGSRTTGMGIDWPVGETVSSKTIGNGTSGGSDTSENGIW